MSPPAPTAQLRELADMSSYRDQDSLSTPVGIDEFGKIGIEDMQQANPVYLGHQVGHVADVKDGLR